jgi:hypothetical protein
MIHFTVSDDPIERLDQLNTLLTEFVFHFDRLDENKILLIKLNLTKWKSAGYSVRLQDNTKSIPDDHNHRITLYKTYSIIGELLLFRKEQDAAVRKQEFEKAAQYRDMQKLQYEKLQTLYLALPTPILFFSCTSNQLEMRLIEQYFLSEYILNNITTD